MNDVPLAGAADPVSLAQQRAVRAYTQVLLDPDLATPAADDAIAAFRETLTQRGAPEGGPSSAAADETLLALTRLMAAVSVPDRSRPEDRRRAVWASIGAASHCTCREAAALLATRANGNIQPRESAALDDHLAGCGTCQALAAATVTAERAFRDALVPPRASGLGLGSLPRAAYGALAVLVAVVAVGLATRSGGHPGSSPGAAAHTTARPVALAISTPTATTTTAPAHRHHVRHRSVPRTRPTGVTTSAPAASAPAPVTAPPASSSATAPAVTSTPSAPASTVAPAAPPPPPAPSAQATPTTASGSSSSSLPADSAPQQGIGTLTNGG